MSKGLGLSYVTPNRSEFYKKNELPYLIVEDGKKIAMPRYYRQKFEIDSKSMKLPDFQELTFEQKKHSVRMRSRLVAERNPVNTVNYAKEGEGRRGPKIK